MPFIGVRISWLIMARKSLLAWLAASAFSLASLSVATSSTFSKPSRSAWRRLSWYWRPVMMRNTA